MVFVIDASLALAIAFGELQTEQGTKVFERLLSERAVAPVLWKWEFANGIVQGVRTGRVEPEEAHQLLAEFGSLPIDMDFTSFDSAWASAVSLAQRHGLTVYDAAYLDLAIHRKLPLGTLDDKLVRAAQAEKIGLIDI